ncbi:hypothetical protein ACT4UM_04660 [Bacillus sp. SS-TM]
MKQELPVLSSRSIEMIESHSPIAKFDLSVMAAETEECSPFFSTKFIQFIM